MLADRHRQGAPRGGRRHDLHPRAVRQGGGQQGVLAIDALVRGGGDLAGQAPEHGCSELGRGVALSFAAQGVDPHLARRIDQDVGHVAPIQPRL